MSCETNTLLQNALSNVFDQSRAQFRTEYDGDKLIYLGHADAGKSEDERGWVIQNSPTTRQAVLNGITSQVAHPI